MPPISDPNEQMREKTKKCDGAPIHKAISNTSGGIGKKDDSAKASVKSAGAPYGVSAHDNTQSYKNLTMCTECHPFTQLRLASSVLLEL